MKPLLTIPEAAELMHAHPNTVWTLINEGKLMAGRIGRSMLVKSDDVLKLVEERMVMQTADRLHRMKAKRAAARAGATAAA